MSSTFLVLVQEYYEEMGYSGPKPTSVVSQTSHKKKAVDWVAKAAYQLESLWFDWNFLWSQWSRSTNIGTANYAAADDIGTWDIESFCLDSHLASYSEIKHIPYKEWRKFYSRGVKSNTSPSMFTILPDKSITLEGPPAAVQTITADYWASPVKMTANASTSLIPTRLERIILVRAKMIHCEYFKDFNRLNLVRLEYGELLAKLEADQLPDRPDRMSEAPIMDIEVM